MKLSNIYYHPQIKKSFLSLPKDIQEKAKERIKIFKEKPFYPPLGAHKLHGKLKEQWSFLIKRQYRIIFIFENSDAIFLDVGTHSIYK